MTTTTNTNLSSFGGSRSWTARARAAAAAAVLTSMTGGLMLAGAAVASAAPAGSPAGECAPFEALTKFDSPFLGNNPTIGDTASSAGVTVKVTGVDVEEGVTSFDWTSAAYVTRIVVKAGAGDTQLSPDAYAGSVTHSAPPAISHVTFCTGEPDEPETDEPDVPETDEPDVPGTDEPDVPGTDEPDVPEVEEPEVEVEEPEVEVLPVVEDPEVEEPEVEEPEIEEPEVEVLPEVVEATPAAVTRTTAAAAQLPRTGTAPLLAALLGSGLVGSGALTLRRTRRG